MQIDWTIVQKIGLNVFLTVSIAWGCFWLIRKIIDMGYSQILQSNNNAFELIKQHTLEREKWFTQYEKLSSSLERSQNYQRQEHIKIIETLERIERRMNNGRG